MRGRAARGRPGGWTLRVILGLVSLGFAAGIAACVAEVRPTSERSAVDPREGGGRRPAPGVMASNASRVMATVRQRTVWPPGSLAGRRPPVRPDRTWYSLMLDVVSSAPTSRDVENFARPGETIEVFSTEPLPEDLVGTNVTAVVQLTGTTEGTRWILTEITPRQ